MIDPCLNLPVHSLCNPWHIFFVGFGGGLAGDLVGLWKGRHERPPQYFSSLYFWFWVVIMAIIGGLLAALVYNPPLQILLVLNIGASAPLILQSLASSAPKDELQRVD